MCGQGKIIYVEAKRKIVCGGKRCGFHCDAEDQSVNIREISKLFL